MLGSAAQNVIALSDSVFLYHLSQEDFASLALSVFLPGHRCYWIWVSLRRADYDRPPDGEGNPEEVGRTFYSMIYFEFGLYYRYVFFHAVWLLLFF